ncbi:hypothetical protein GCM10025794_31350 [Massilia kyonggiensis]
MWKVTLGKRDTEREWYVHTPADPVAPNVIAWKYLAVKSGQVKNGDFISRIYMVIK